MLCPTVQVPCLCLEGFIVTHMDQHAPISWNMVDFTGSQFHIWLRCLLHTYKNCNLCSVQWYKSFVHSLMAQSYPSKPQNMFNYCQKNGRKYTCLCCWWIAHRPSENWGPSVVQCCKSKDFQWTGLNSQPSRQLLDFLCPFGPGSAHNMGPRLAGILVKIQVQLPSPVTLLLPTVSVALLSRILGV